MKELTIQEWLNEGYTIEFWTDYQYSTLVKKIDGVLCYILNNYHLEEPSPFNEIAANKNNWKPYPGEIDTSNVIGDIDKIITGNEKKEHLAGCFSNFQTAIAHVSQGGTAEFIEDGTILYLKSSERYNYETSSHEEIKRITDISDPPFAPSWCAEKPEYFTNNSWKIIELT